MNPIFLPEEKLESLAQQISEELIETQVFPQGNIQGEALKEFCQHTQINKFLLFQVYQVWNIQLSKLRHPYFDFDHPDIQESLTLLRNQLSQHISIPRQEFLPLLKRAVYNNLKLLLDAEASFTSFFFVNGDSIPLERFERYAPFFADLDFVVNSLLHYFRNRGIQTIDKDVFFLKMKRVIDLYDQKGEETFEAYRANAFHKLTGRELVDVEREAEEELRELELRKREMEEREDQEREAEEQRKREEEEARRREEASRKTSFFDTIEGDGGFIELDEEDGSSTREVPVREDEGVERREGEAEEEPTPEAPGVEPVEDTDKEFLEMAQSLEPDAEEGEDEEQGADADDEDDEEKISSVKRYEWEDESEQDTDGQPEIVEIDVSVEKEAEEEEKTEEAESQSGQLEQLIEGLKIELEEKEEKDETPTEEEPESTLEHGEAEEESVEEEANQEQEPAAEKSDSPQTIADKFAGEQGTSLADRLAVGGEKKTTSLGNIPLHEEYQIVQKVFKGNNVRYRIILDKVNKSADRAEVEEILERFVLANDELDKGDPVVVNFIEMIRAAH